MTGPDGIGSTKTVCYREFLLRQGPLLRIIRVSCFSGTFRLSTLLQHSIPGLGRFGSRAGMSHAGAALKVAAPMF